jgi:hypothetical protein
MQVNNMADIMVRVDEETKKEFQIYCVKTDTSMQEILSNFIRELMKKQNDSKSRRRVS